MDKIRPVYSGQSDDAVGKEFAAIKAEVNRIQQEQYANATRPLRIDGNNTLIKRDLTDGKEDELYKKDAPLTSYDGIRLKEIEASFNALGKEHQTPENLPLRESFAGTPGHPRDVKASDGKTYTISISNNQNDGRKISVIEKTQVTTPTPAQPT